LPRIKQGDIFETSVLGSLAYLQFLKSREYFGEVIRVFTTLHDSSTDDIRKIHVDPSFLVFYPVKAALKATLVRLISNAPLRNEDLLPLNLRGGFPQGPWDIYEEGKPTREVHSLSEEEVKLPAAFPMVSHSWLLHLILKANGINVPVSALTVSTVEVANDETMFFILFDTKADARRAAAKLGTSDLLKTLRVRLEKGTSKWELTLIGKVRTVDESTVSSLESLAAEFNGTFDGFEAPLPG
jgi:hypothetical protein